ncbi:MAG: hypothetical protein JNK66_10480 [Chitinophagales bacterium]|nr:hypothetical protein [Chitinophagales bacterium]
MTGHRQRSSDGVGMQNVIYIRIVLKNGFWGLVTIGLQVMDSKHLTA